MTADKSTWELILQTEASPVCAFDLDYRLTAFNQAHSDGFFGIYAYRVKVGDVFPDLFLPDQAPVMRGFMSRALAGETFDVVQEFGDPDLSKPFWQISYTPLRDASGKVVGAFHRVQDISARLRTEAELAAAQQLIEQSNLADRRLRQVIRKLDDQFRNVVDPSAIAQLAAEAVGQALEVGAAGYGTLREDGETLDVLSDWSSPGTPSIAGTLFVPSFGEHLGILRKGEDVVVNDVETDVPRVLDVAACLAIGARSVVNVPVMEGGRLVAVFFVLFAHPRSWSRIELDFVGNVAERARAGVERRRAEAALRKVNESLERRVEQALAERETRFRLLAEALPIGILAADAASRFDYLNPWIERELGYSLAELQPERWASVIHPEDLPMFQSRWAAMASGGPTAQMEYRLRRKDGDYRWYLTRALLTRDSQQAPTRIIASVMDIQELVGARLKAEESTRAKSAFLSSMSHEIRTPMNAIIGMTTILAESVQTPEQAELTEIIRNSSDHLLTIINDILDYSKIEAGRIELENEPFSLRECLESTLDLLSVGAQAKRIEMVYLMNAGVPEGLRGDISRLRQILLNLLSNAVKFTPVGGHIALEVSAQGPEPALGLVFSVRDSGIGMSQAQQAKLFQPFTQADSSTTRTHGGTGLGLSISKRLVEIMGGRIWVESRPDEGSTFSFTILAEPASGNFKAPSALPPSLDRRRALIVDDIQINCRILQHYTRAWGLESRATQSPAEALAWLRDGETFDLALLDFNMPEVDGLALATELRKLRGEAALPIVIISSVPLDSRYAGIVGATVMKPIKPARLFETVLRALSGATENRQPEGDRRDVPRNLGKTKPLRILIAEDNVVNQKVAQLLFRRMGYEPDFAANGEEALNAVGRQIYDVVFMDVQMPVMDGLEATRAIRAQFADGSRPRIVGMTANALGEDRAIALECGMDDYLTKPIVVDQLVEAFSRCVRRAAH